MADNKEGIGAPAEVVALETAAAVGAGVIAAIHPMAGVLAAGLIPAGKQLLEIALHAWNSRSSPARAAAVVLGAGLSDDTLRDPSFTAKLEESDTMMLSTVVAAITDDEAAKAWAYGALLGAFHADTVAREQRVTIVKFVKECSNYELLRIIDASQIAALANRIENDHGFRAALLSALRAAEAKTRDPHARLANAVAVALYGTANGRIEKILSQYGYVVATDHISYRVLSELLPIFESAAYRSGVLIKITDEEFVQRVVDFANSYERKATQEWERGD